jgi:putative peptide maturation system protein
MDGIQLLKILPRERAREREVSEMTAAFQQAHPEVSAELLIDKQPGHPEMDFDLYLHSDTSGAIALGWRPDRCMPWVVQYSEHWASNLVLSVNGRDLTIQEALQALRLHENTGADLATELVNFCLVDSALLKDPPIVSPSELQHAADGFRAKRGLYDAEKTYRWLAEASLSTERFEALIKAAVQTRKLRERITRHQVEAYFASHSENFARTSVVRLHSASEQPLRKFVLSEVGIADLIESALSAHSHIGDQGIRVVIETGLAEDVLPMLSPGSTTSPYSSTVSPGRSGDGYCLSLVLRSTPAKLDKEITTRIEERLFASWLSEERAKAQVTWHWM